MKNDYKKKIQNYNMVGGGHNIATVPTVFKVKFLVTFLKDAEKENFLDPLLLD